MDDTEYIALERSMKNIALKRCQVANKPGEAPTFGSRKGGSAMQSSPSGS